MMRKMIDVVLPKNLFAAIAEPVVGTGERRFRTLESVVASHPPLRAEAMEALRTYIAEKKPLSTEEILGLPGFYNSGVVRRNADRDEFEIPALGYIEDSESVLVYIQGEKSNELQQPSERLFIRVPRSRYTVGDQEVSLAQFRFDPRVILECDFNDLKGWSEGTIRKDFLFGCRAMFGKFTTTAIGKVFSLTEPAEGSDVLLWFPAGYDVIGRRDFVKLECGAILITSKEVSLDLFLNEDESCVLAERGSGPKLPVSRKLLDTVQYLFEKVTLGDGGTMAQKALNEQLVLSDDEAVLQKAEAIRRKQETQEGIELLSSQYYLPALKRLFTLAKEGLDLSRVSRRGVVEFKTKMYEMTPHIEKAAGPRGGFTSAPAEFEFSVGEIEFDLSNPAHREEVRTLVQEIEDRYALIEDLMRTVAVRLSRKFGDKLEAARVKVEIDVSDVAHIQRKEARSPLEVFFDATLIGRLVTVENEERIMVLDLGDVHNSEALAFVSTRKFLKSLEFELQEYFEETDGVLRALSSGKTKHFHGVANAEDIL